MIKDMLVVGLGGAIGAVLRYGSSLLGGAVGLSSQVTTLIVNILGSCAIGYFLGLCKPGSLLLFLTVGVCGSFTTFSTFSSQSVLMIQDGKYWGAAAYVLASVVLCMIFTFLGYKIAGSAA